MIAVDTNLIVRILTRDDPAQAEAAVERIRDEPVLIAKTVILETEWVLRYTYGFTAEEIGAALRKLTALENAKVEDAEAVHRALAWYATGMDFADALHVASTLEADAFVTFDRRLYNAAGRIGGPIAIEHLRVDDPADHG